MSNPTAAHTPSKTRWKNPVRRDAARYCSTISDLLDTDDINRPLGPYREIFIKNAGGGLNYVFYILIRHASRQRQGHDPLELPQGDGELFRHVAILFAIVAEQVNGDKVHRATDVSIVHFPDKLIPCNAGAFQVQAQHVNVPRVLDIPAL